MNSIQTALVKSGKVRFTRSISEMQQGVDELQRQNQSGLYKQRHHRQGRPDDGRQSTSLKAELTSIVKQNNTTKDVFYKFTLKMFDVQEGTIEWRDEKEIRKTSKKLTGAHHATQNHPAHGPGRGRHHHAGLGQQRPGAKRGPQNRRDRSGLAARVSEYFVAGAYQRSAR